MGSSEDKSRLGYQGMNFNELASRSIYVLLADESPELRDDYNNLVLDRGLLENLARNNDLLWGDVYRATVAKIKSIEANLSYKGVPPEAVAEIMMGISSIDEDGHLVRDKVALQQAMSGFVRESDSQASPEQQFADAMQRLGTNAIAGNAARGITFSQAIAEASEK